MLLLLPRRQALAAGHQDVAAALPLDADLVSYRLAAGRVDLVHRTSGLREVS